MNLIRLPSFLICILPTLLLADPVAELPMAAKKLQQAYRKSADHALLPIRERYLKELTKLSDQAIKDKNLSEAVVLKAEINSIIAATMTGEWNDKPGVMFINPNGTLAHSNGATGTWTIKGDEMVLDWSNGAKHFFPLILTKDILKGKVGVDRPISVTLTRE
jgi:hypothetical protein